MDGASESPCAYNKVGEIASIFTSDHCQDCITFLAGLPSPCDSWCNCFGQLGWSLVMKVSGTCACCCNLPIFITNSAHAEHWQIQQAPNAFLSNRAWYSHCIPPTEWSEIYFTVNMHRIMLLFLYEEISCPAVRNIEEWMNDTWKETRKHFTRQPYCITFFNDFIFNYFVILQHNIALLIVLKCWGVFFLLLVFYLS